MDLSPNVWQPPGDVPEAPPDVAASAGPPTPPGLPLGTPPVVSRRLPYMVQLDGIRGLGVMTVMLHHYAELPQGAVNVGFMAIRMFFVLSGFLITGVLLRGDAQDRRAGRPRSHTLKQFYLQRGLRILPAYYAALAFALLLDLGGMRDIAAWHATFTSNFLFAWQGHYSSIGSHLWSLAVEEQFYLLWPFVVLFLPRQRLGTALAAVILVSLAAKAALAAAWPNELGSIVLLPACTDAIGIGALLGYSHFTGNERLQRGLRLGGFLAGTWLLATSLFIEQLGAPVAWTRAVAGTAMAAASVGILDIAAGRGFRRLAPLLENRVLVSIGRLSYGLYLWHLFMLSVVLRLIAWMGWEIPSSLAVRILLFSAATGIAATASWIWIEQPMNRLKARLDR